MIVAGQVEMGIPDLAESIEDLRQCSLGSCAGMSMPEQDSEFFMLAKLDIEVLSAIGVGQFQHRGNERAQVPKYRDASSLVISSNVSEDSMSSRSPQFAKTVYLALLFEEIVEARSRCVCMGRIDVVSCEECEAVRLVKNPVSMLYDAVIAAFDMPELHVRNLDQFN